MKNIDIILKGGYKSCCSVYPASQLRLFLKDWFSPKDEVNLVIIDIEKDYWETDLLADFAFKSLGDACFPLVYLNDELISVSKFPEKTDLVGWMTKKPVLTEDKILRLQAELK